MFVVAQTGLKRGENGSPSGFYMVVSLNYCSQNGGYIYIYIYI